MYIPSPKALAQFVINQRKKLKLSQEDVGNRVGLKQKTISAFENKPEGTKIDTLFDILSAVNLDIHISVKNEDANIPSEWKEEW
jgi:HTH-type transcriptional regulator / antitoxin HipB